MTEKMQSGPMLLAKLREPFPEHHISKLPKPTKAQTDEVRADFKKGVRCEVCGGWHHPKVVHLDYVGHAALTDRLLDSDMEWSWEPLAVDQYGLPAFDGNNGLWIRLTVQGVSRLGYGSADGKTGGDAIKEIIGDALRNAAMRFGAALDLWHKGDLHIDEAATPVEAEKSPYITPAQELHMEDLARDIGVDLSQWLIKAGIASGKAKDLEAEHFDAAVKAIEKRRKPRAASGTPEVGEDDVPYK